MESDKTAPGMGGPHPTITELRDPQHPNHFEHLTSCSMCRSVVAADLEDHSEKHIVTPGRIVPARELLGDMLLELRQPGAAMAEYEASQQREPNRFRGLYGAARAAEAAGEKDKAARYYGELVALTRNADVVRPELAQAKAFLAQR